jgi:hypothetical protein
MPLVRFLNEPLVENAAERTPETSDQVWRGFSARL